MMMMRTTMAIGAWIAIAGMAGAAEPRLTPTQQAAERLLVVTQWDQTFRAQSPKIIDAMLPMLIRGNTGREAELRKIMAEEFGGAMMRMTSLAHDRTRDLYAARFTADELDGLARFYASPLGRKATAQAPDIQLEMLKFGQQAGGAAMQAVLPRIVQRMRAANMAVPQGV